MHAVFRVYYLLLIANVILSWIRIPYNPVVRFIYEVTEPPLDFCRRLLRLQAFGLDFSPVIVILLMELIEKFLVRLILMF